VAWDAWSACFFFLVLALGAITSTISLLEVVTASMMDELGCRAASSTADGRGRHAGRVVPAMSLDVSG